jgi:hypothetical protein
VLLRECSWRECQRQCECEANDHIGCAVHTCLLHY